MKKKGGKEKDDDVEKKMGETCVYFIDVRVIYQEIWIHHLAPMNVFCYKFPITVSWEESRIHFLKNQRFVKGMVSVIKAISVEMKLWIDLPQTVADPGGATGRPPPKKKNGSTVIFFITHFVSECLKIGLR